jgi:hypothetical protein
MANVVFEAAQQLMKQMQVVQKCNDADLELEAKRAEAMSKLAGPIAAAAKAEAAIYIATGTLPENNLLFSKDEKVVTSASIESHSKKLKGGLLIDELTKK